MAEKLSAETRQHMLKKMLEIRYCEERIQELFLENVIRGTTHLCIGQEAVSLAMADNVNAKRGDTVTCTYRGHGHALSEVTAEPTPVGDIEAVGVRFGSSC